MTKCALCNQNKAKRFCAGISGTICSFCCGTKREKEIICFHSCEYLKQGKKYQNSRIVSKLVNENFNEKAEDIYQDDSNNELISKFTFPLETFFIEQFYNDSSISDNDIYTALEKLYLYRLGTIKELEPSNQCQKLIFAKFENLNEKTKLISGDLKNKAILRILKSIKNVSGGVFGNRNYMEVVYSNFNSDGKWSDMFDELK